MSVNLSDHRDPAAEAIAKAESETSAALVQFGSELTGVPSAHEIYKQIPANYSAMRQEADKARSEIESTLADERLPAEFRGKFAEGRKAQAKATIAKLHEQSVTAAQVLDATLRQAAMPKPAADLAARQMVQSEVRNLLDPIRGQDLTTAAISAAMRRPEYAAELLSSWGDSYLSGRGANADSRHLVSLKVIHGLGSSGTGTPAQQAAYKALRAFQERKILGRAAAGGSLAAMRLGR